MLAAAGHQNGAASFQRPAPGEAIEGETEQQQARKMAAWNPTTRGGESSIIRGLLAVW